LNTGQPHLVETIATSICSILNRKGKVTHTTYIYRVLQAKNKNKYVSDYGKNKRLDIYSKRNVSYNEIREAYATLINYFSDVPKLDQEKQNELENLRYRYEEVQEKIATEQLDTEPQNSSSDIPQEDTDSQENNNNNNSTDTSSGSNNQSQNQSKSGHTTTSGYQSDHYPQKQESKYYKRLEQYITILQKLRENVLRFPPSKQLDDMLDKSLAVEIEILMPAIDMKFKRSIAQLDETIQYANDQSLNGASSVMHEKAMVRDDEKGQIIDPNNYYAKFLEITHKLTPEQIDTRRFYISNIRRMMAKYNPHLYYHIMWYEGSDKYNHKLAMGKFARANLLKKRMVIGN
jgi:hypothetical protein